MPTDNQQMPILVLMPNGALVIELFQMLHVVEMRVNAGDIPCIAGLTARPVLVRWAAATTTKYVQELNAASKVKLRELGAGLKPYHATE
jgi:hypothetical protein